MSIESNTRQVIRVVRKRGPDWLFVLETEGELPGRYVHRTRKNVYSLEIDTDDCFSALDVWIGKHWESNGRRIIGTVEGRLGAVYADLGRGRYYWRKTDEHN